MPFDAIVVGARCAGSPTAMLLARAGHRVLLVDRARFPSDTNSTHSLTTQGVARLQRWDLLAELERSNCPATRTCMLDLGTFALSAVPPRIDGLDQYYAPRRRVLDAILIRAASRAGVEVREQLSVSGLLIEGSRVVGIRARTHSGGTTVEKAKVVIGADGMGSCIANLVGAQQYDQHRSLTCMYYSYFANVPCDSFEIYAREGSSAGVFPTHDGLTVIFVQRPATEFDEFRRDPSRAFWSTLQRIPLLYERATAGSREEPFRGMGYLPNFFRKPWGSGWALVGDAGYHRDPTLGQGMSDAFRDAELLAAAVDAGLSGREQFHVALARYERLRNEAAKPMYDLVCKLARLQLPGPAILSLFKALRHDPDECGRFFGVLSGAVPVQEFFCPQNVSRITASGRSEIPRRNMIAMLGGVCAMPLTGKLDTGSKSTRGEQNAPQLKTIGILGGLGPQATTDFEARLHRAAQKFIKQHENSGYPPMIVYYHRHPPVLLNGDLTPRLPLQADPRLLEAASRLGIWADFLVMPSNRPHVLQDQIERAAGRELLSIIKVTLAEIQRRGWRNVGVLGFGDPSLYTEPLRKMGLACETIEGEMRVQLNQQIMKVMEGRDDDRSVTIALEAVNLLRAKGTDGIILGCTELPLLLRGNENDPDLLNPAQILVEAALRRAIA